VLYLKKGLSQRGFEVQVYFSIKDILKDTKLNLLSSDIILLDMQLPHISGHQIFRLLKSASLTNSIPIIAITGNKGIKEANKLLTHGLDDIVKKPLMMNVLLRKMQQCMPTY
jgi:DNA-binding response OmpR family regulator